MDDPAGILALTACDVDLVSGAVARNGISVPLTSRESDLLRFLVANRGQSVSRDRILGEVFGYSDDVVSRACDNTVRRLRAKIEVDASNPDHLLTVHGTGYRFVLGGSGTPQPEPRAIVAQPIVALGPVRIDLERRRILRPDREHPVTEAEAGLLDALIRAEGRVVERAALVRAGWGAREAGAQRLLDNTISALRAKLEPDPTEPRFLHTARGTGYRLERTPDRARDAELFGRDSLIAECLDAMASSAWVLLLGPPGVGKSRLARHLAGQVDRTVIWVDQTAARSVAECAAAVAAAVGVDRISADPVETVRQALAGRKRALVVLDNLERAPVGLASWVAALVQAAPDVRWLGTSRVRLGVPDERVIEVGPLDPGAAIAMFVRRAAAASPGTPPVDPRLPALRQLVDRLDRLPLAIELAATRVRILAIDELLARLDVDLLVRARPLDERHHSLRAAIGASLDALSKHELVGLGQISLFSKGLFVDDAEGLFGAEAIDLLQTLRDHSLLVLVPDDTGLRFATWHAVRELLAAHRDPELVRRHCRWLGRRGTLDQDLSAPAAAARHRALLEEDVAATRLALTLGDGALAASCAIAACWTLTSRGGHAAGLPLIDEVLRTEVPPSKLGPLLVHKAPSCSRPAGSATPLTSSARRWRCRSNTICRWSR